MKSIVWSDLYRKSGLWGCLKKFTQLNHTISSGIYINVPKGHEFDLDFEGNIKPYDKSYANIKKIMIIEKENYYEICLPVRLHKKIIFIFHFKTMIEFNQKELKMIKFNLDLFLLYESVIQNIYPSFMIFLYPVLGYLKAVNNKITCTIEGKNFKKDSFIFLNGQPGTGKFSFFQCFLLFHYNVFLHFLITKNELKQPISRFVFQTKEVEKSEKEEKTKTETIFFVPELAILNQDQQNLLITEYNKEKELNYNTNRFTIIAASVYDINVLTENNIISEKLANICRENKIIIPSLLNRGQDIRPTIEFIQAIKPGFFADKFKQIKAENTKKIHQEILNAHYNFDDIYNKVFDDKSIDESILKLNQASEIKLEYEHDNKLNLRDIIMKVEKSAIKYAHSKVGDSQHKISDFLGISRGSLQNKLKKYNLDYSNWSE